MAFAATKKQGTISEYWFDEDSFLWRYAFTFSDPSAASKFLEIAKEGKSIQDAADAAGVEIECDSDENVVKATSVGDRKATVITISEKLPCVEDWYKIAKSYDVKADVTCRALAQETGEKYFNYRYIGDGNKGKPVLVQGNVKESKEMEEEGKELVGIDNLKIEKDYIDDNGKKFDIYYDTVEESPRKMYDNGATIVILRGKYESPDEITDELEEIADEHGISLSKDCDLNALISALQEAGYYAVPVYILDHGNVHYSTHDFGDKWDSGMAGVAYAKKSGADEKKLQKMIDAELAEYETWANGNVYGISVRNEDGEVVDGESGFYLSNDMTWEDLIKEMLDAVEVKIQDKYERFHGFEDDEDDYEDDEDRRKRFDEGVDESEAHLSMDPEDIGYSHMYKFTFKQIFEAKKFFDFIKKYGNGGSLLKAINDLSVGIEVECDVEEWILTVLNQSAQKRVTVITISDKLPCIDEWEAIAKAFHAKLKYESLDDEQEEKQVFVQRNVKESNKEEETNMEESRKPKEKISDFVGIDKLELETDYVDNKGNVFDIYKYEDTNNDLYGISVRDDDGEVIDGENGFILKAGMSMLDLIKEMMDTVEVNIQDSYLKKGKRPRSKRVYAEIQSTDSPSHITWFKDLKTARRELENHIAAMTKVGDYEIFRDEEAADIKMQEGDVEITLYVPSGSEDIVDNDVEHVIIRPKKETVKEEINNMEKHIVDLMNKTKVIGNPIYKTDFWFYVEGINDKDGNPSVFHAFEGTGDNLLSDDREQGFVDYILYEVYTGKITYPMIDAYVSGDDIDTLMDFQYDEGMVLLRNYCSYLTVKQICCMVLDEFGVKNTDNLTVRILTGKQKDTSFPKETNESFDDTNSSTSKTDVTPVMNKIKVIGNPSDKSDFLFYCSEIRYADGNPVVFCAQEGIGDNLDDEQEEQGFIDYIYYFLYEDVGYSKIKKFLLGDYDVLNNFEGDSDFVYLYDNYRDLTVQQICWKILHHWGCDNPEILTVRILEGMASGDAFKKDAEKNKKAALSNNIKETNESLDDTDASGTKTDVTPMMNKIKVIGNPVDKSDFWFYVYNKDVDKQKTYHVYEGTGDNLSIEDEKQGFVDYINYDSYKGVDGVGGLDAIDVINNYISGDDEDTLSGFEDDGGMVLLYNPYKNLTVKQICWKVLDMDGVPHPENLTAIILSTVSEIWG